MQPVIEVRDLSFRYGSEAVLNEVSFSVTPGDFIAVIGSNGAGKSTLLRLLLGELEPAGGDILLFGEPVSGFCGWPKIGYVPQNPAAAVGGFPATVEEIVIAGLYAKIGPLRPVRKVHRQQAREALGLVGMSGCSGRMIFELSGGQLQRVMVARVLAAGCRVMLLDEPTTGVDAASSDALYELLARLNKQGMTILMVTHDVAKAAGYVGRALCLEEGSLVELEREQLVHELSHRHKHPGKNAV